jgi:hypothetical protein
MVSLCLQPQRLGLFSPVCALALSEFEIRGQIGLMLSHLIQTSKILLFFPVCALALFRSVLTAEELVQ